MKCKSILAAVVATAVSTLFFSGAKAGTIGSITLTSSASDYSYSLGGEFLATELMPGTAGAAGVTQASPVSMSLTSFQTFCIDAGVNDVVFNSGDSFSTTIVDQKGPPVPGATLLLSNTAAALYGAFSEHALADYAYTGGSPARNDSAGELQYAIWIAQGDSSATSGQQDKVFATEADYVSAVNAMGYDTTNLDLSQSYTWYSTALTSYKAYGSGVAVLNLTDISVGSAYKGDTAQAQLVDLGSDNPNISTPLPRSAFAGFAMLAGLGGFELFRKRQGGKLELA